MLQPNTDTISSFCDLPDAGCVMVRQEGGHIEVRDSKQGSHSPVLRFTPAEWATFTEGVKAGEFATDQAPRTATPATPRRVLARSEESRCAP